MAWAIEGPALRSPDSGLERMRSHATAERRRAPPKRASIPGSYDSHR